MLCLSPGSAAEGGSPLARRDPLAWQTFLALYAVYSLICGALTERYLYPASNVPLLGYPSSLGSAEPWVVAGLTASSLTQSSALNFNCSCSSSAGGRTEVDIALGRQLGADVTSKFADPVALSCPACGGALSQVRRPPVRFRCQAGHTYSAEVLDQAKESAVDEAVRVGLRIVEKPIVLTQKWPRWLVSPAGPLLPLRFEKPLDESRGHAETLRQGIERAKSSCA